MKKLIVIILTLLSAYGYSQAPAVDKMIQLKSGQLVSLDKIFNDSSSIAGKGMVVVPKGTGGSVKDSFRISQGLLDSLTTAYGREPVIGNPGTNGYFLTRNTDGTNIWVPNSGGTDYSTSNTTYTGSNIFSPPATTVFKGNVNSDGGIIGSEILTNSNWTTTDWLGDFTVGFDHVTGNTSVLSNTLAAVSGSSYLIVATVTGRTAGTFVMAFGGVTLPSASATVTYAMLASSTANFTVTPTSDFDGSIVFSIKVVSTYTANIIYRSFGDVSQSEKRFGASGTSIYEGIGAGRRTLSTAGANTAYGHQAMLYNVNGANNTVVGAYSLGSSSRSSQITTVGQGSLQSYLSGDQMTAVGALSLYHQLGGSGVTALGYNSGRRIADNVTASTIQNNSVFIGHDARPLADNQTNQNVVGYGTIGNGSNTSTWGNTSTIGHYFTGQHFLGGYGTGSTYTGTPIGNLQVTASGAMIVGAVGGGAGDVVTTSSNSFTNTNIFTGTTGTDGPTLVAEILTTGTLGANWTGTNFATGYTHTAGSIETITSADAAVLNSYYQIAYTVSGRTAGSFTITFGGATIGSFTATGASGPRATSTGTLTVTPTTDFDGTIILSIREIGTSTAIMTWRNSGGTNINEIRTPTSSTNYYQGVNAGRRNTTGTNNMGIGTSALSSVTTGFSNTAVGANALQFNHTGANNTAFGGAALQNNTTAVGNSAFGLNSLNSTTTGSGNIGIGQGTGFSSTTAIYNTIIGYNAFYSNIGGSENIVLGQNAARFLTDGTTALTSISTSVLIGTGTKASANSQTNAIAIGYNVVTEGSNTTAIGNSSMTLFAVHGNAKLLGSTNHVILPQTVTAAATTGAQTINKALGKVNFAAAATTLVVTNSLVTTSSHVQVQVEGTDATATSARVTLAAGSFTITLNAAATAETRVSFHVTNGY